MACCPRATPPPKGCSPGSSRSPTSGRCAPSAGASGLSGSLIKLCLNPCNTAGTILVLL